MYIEVWIYDELQQSIIQCVMGFKHSQRLEMSNCNVKCEQGNGKSFPKTDAVFFLKAVFAHIFFATLRACVIWCILYYSADGPD